MNSFKKIDKRLLHYSCNFAARLRKDHAKVRMKCDQGQAHRGDALEHGPGHGKPEPMWGKKCDPMKTV